MYKSFKPASLRKESEIKNNQRICFLPQIELTTSGLDYTRKEKAGHRKKNVIVICLPMERLGVLENSLKCVCAFQIEMEFGSIGF